MNYTVIWKPEADRRLADIWLNAADRAAVTAAAHQIDQKLRRDPENEGESRDKGRRIQLVAPLGVLYRVAPDDRLVNVVAVWAYK